MNLIKNVIVFAAAISFAAGASALASDQDSKKSKTAESKTSEPSKKEKTAQPKPHQPATPAAQPKQPSAPVAQPKPHQPATPAAQPKQPSAPVAQPKPQQPSAPVAQPKPQQPSTPVAQPKPHQPSTPVAQPKPQQPSTPVSKNTTPAVKPTKDGGHVETNQGQITKYDSENKVRRVKDPTGKDTKFDKNGKAVAVSEPVKVDGKVVGKNTQIVDPKTGNTVVKKNVQVENGVVVKNQYNAKTNVQYVEHTKVVNKTVIVQRTYVQNNTYVVRNYYPTYYGSYRYYTYTPSAFWTGFLVGVAAAQIYDSVWTAPYRHVWCSPYDAWCTYYGAYWVPVYDYRRADDYILDRMMARYAAARYAERAEEAAERAEAAAARAEQIVRDEEIRQQLIAQQREELNAFKKGESVPLQKIVNTPNQIFIVDDSLDVTDLQDVNNPDDCTLSPGDIVRTVRVAGNTQDVTVQLIKTRTEEDSCKVSALIVLSVDQVANMHNAFTEHVEAGAEELKNR